MKRQYEQYPLHSPLVRCQLMLALRQHQFVQKHCPQWQVVGCSAAKIEFFRAAQLLFREVRQLSQNLDRVPLPLCLFGQCAIPYRLPWLQGEVWNSLNERVIQPHRSSRSLYPARIDLKCSDHPALRQRLKLHR